MSERAGAPATSRPRPATLAHALLVRDPGNAALDDWIARSGDPLARATAAMARGDIAAARAALEGFDTKALLPQRRMAFVLLQGLQELIAGEHAAAAEAARTGLAAAESEGLRGWHAWLRMLPAAAALVAGERDAARLALQAIEGTARLRRGDRALVHYLHGWLATLEGDGAAARREAKTALGSRSTTTKRRSRRTSRRRTSRNTSPKRCRCSPTGSATS